MALPDVSTGVQTTLMRDKRWLSTLREPDVCQLLNVPRAHLQNLMKHWQSSQAFFSDEVNFDETLESVGSSEFKLARYGAAAKTPRKSLLTAAPLDIVPERLTIPRLIALLVLGMMMCQENTLISDLLRWIRALQFPCIDPKLTENNREVYMMMAAKNSILEPSYHQIEGQLSVVAKLLQIEANVIPAISLPRIIDRFVEELNLPRAFTAFVVGFVDQINSLEFSVDLKGFNASSSKRRAANVEAFVMACVIYSLRFLFWLDDDTERRISKCTADLQELVKDDMVQFFNFEVSWTIPALRR